MIRTDKAALRVAAVAAEEGGRYAIDHVQVEGNGTCAATDGRRLVAVQGFPDEEGAADEPVLIRGTLAAVVCGDPTEPPLFVNIEGDEAKTQIRYKTDRGDAAVTLNVPTQADMQFPDWRSMMAEDDGELVGNFDAAYLAGVLDTMASSLRALGTHRPCVTIRKHEKGQLSIAAEAGGRGVLGVIAPVKIFDEDNEEKAPTLDWVKK